jgi:PPOX class probable F420-dependent enzyme
MALPDDVRELLAGTNYAHVATMLPDGSPHSVAVWIDLHDGRPFFFTQEASRKARNLARDPRVAISITDRRNPYRSAWVRGEVAETRTGDAALELIDQMARKYTGEPFPMRSGVVFIVEPALSRHFQLPFEAPPPQ